MDEQALAEIIKLYDEQPQAVRTTEKKLCPDQRDSGPVQDAVRQVQSEDLPQDISDGLEDAELQDTDQLTHDISEAISKLQEAASWQSVADQDYNRHTQVFKDFVSNYVENNGFVDTTKQPYEYQEGQSGSTGNTEELISYKEKVEVARAIQMNALMHGNHNYVSPEAKERYEHWKNLSKFNTLLSHLMYDRAIS